MLFLRWVLAFDNIEINHATIFTSASINSRILNVWLKKEAYLPIQTLLILVFVTSSRDFDNV